VKTAYLSLGSNLGDRAGNLRRAVELLASPDILIMRTSSLYETEPQDLHQQPWFLNQVVEIETRYFPMQLLGRIQSIEREMGRRRTVAKGPRVIDIDIILFGNFIIETPRLQVPHPRMPARRFVLEPLAELVPELRHPITRRTVGEMLRATMGQVVKIVTG
jgi:2-amino-4-hydroxy-6-hydroxymethyldihydropteridine diphosphokinase